MFAEYTGMCACMCTKENLYHNSYGMANALLSRFLTDKTAKTRATLWNVKMSDGPLLSTAAVEMKQVSFIITYIIIIMV